MRNTNKALLLLLFIMAVVLGVVISHTHTKDSINTDVLRAAELLQSEQPLAANSVQNLMGRATLVNFWASYCRPCLEEMPMMDGFYRRFRSNGLQVIGITIDSPENSRATLDSMDIQYPILYAEKTGFDLMRSTGNPQAVIPYSLLLDEKGRVLHNYRGQLSLEQLQQWVHGVLEAQ